MSILYEDQSLDKSLFVTTMESQSNFIISRLVANGLPSLLLVISKTKAA
ncbi:hypothetical protein [Moorena producens]